MVAICLKILNLLTSKIKTKFTTKNNNGSIDERTIKAEEAGKQPKTVTDEHINSSDQLEQTVETTYKKNMDEKKYKFIYLRA